MPRRKSLGYGEYAGQAFGLARIMDESPFTDGSSAHLIENFHLDERGFLINNPRLMWFLPKAWRMDQWNPDWMDPVDNVWKFFPTLSTTLAMKFMRRDGEVPEIIFLTTMGVFRFAPWTRNTTGNTSGLEEQRYFPVTGTSHSVKPGSVSRYPAQMEVVANKMYFTYGDGGAVWLWDGAGIGRIRKAGFTAKPSPPSAVGPMRSRTGVTGYENTGGWTHHGRIGTAESNWTEEVGSTPAVKTVGGIDVGRWRYAVVFEGVDGSYSPISEHGGHVSIRKEVCGETEYPDELMKKFRVFDIPTGPDNAAARILLRTRNLERLPPGDDGSFRFLHRIPNTMATEYVDDIPDGELGAEWQDREPFPVGVYFLKHFSGSMFYLRTDGSPSRIWWSEQEPTSGPIPESILFGHWMEAFPETGAITGAHSAVLPGQQSVPVLLIFKQDATHFLTGSYPSWQIGTLHPSAGCAGPGLVQTTPSGDVIWYGSNTFWRLSSDGVQDIGVTIRKRLQRVNQKTCRKGISWFDATNRELVFWLPSDDADKPNVGFVWDYQANGWRLLTTLTDVKAALSIPSESLLLVNATYAEAEALWVYGRSFPYSGVGSTVDMPATYTSGWLTLSEFSPDMHKAKRGAWLVVTGEDYSDGEAQVSVYRNHNNVDPATEPQPLSCSHPEDEIPAYGSAVYGVDYWRSPRIFATQAPIDAPNARAIQVTIETEARMALFNVDVYGPIVSGPFSRTSGGEG